MVASTLGKSQKHDSQSFKKNSNLGRHKRQLQPFHVSSKTMGVYFKQFTPAWDGHWAGESLGKIKQHLGHDISNYQTYLFHSVLSEDEEVHRHFDSSFCYKKL